MATIFRKKRTRKLSPKVTIPSEQVCLPIVEEQDRIYGGYHKEHKTPAAGPRNNEYADLWVPLLWCDKRESTLKVTKDKQTHETIIVVLKKTMGYPGWARHNIHGPAYVSLRWELGTFMGKYRWYLEGDEVPPHNTICMVGDELAQYYIGLGFTVVNDKYVVENIV